MTDASDSRSTADQASSQNGRPVEFVAGPAAEDTAAINSPLRKLSAAGLSRMREELDGIGPADWPGFSAELLSDNRLAPVVDDAVIVRPQWFDTRAELAEAIAELIDRSKLTPQAATRMPGLWSWLAAYWCDAFRREGGWIGVKSEEYWFTQTRARGSHLTLSAYEAWLATTKHKGKGRQVLLYSHPSTLPVLCKDLAGNRRLQRNPAVLDVAAALYLTPTEIGPLSAKKHAVSQGVSGGFRRFLQLLDQFDRTYDLHDLSPQRLWNLLPSEFEAFKDGPLQPTDWEAGEAVAS